MLRVSLAERRPGYVVETLTMLTTETNNTASALHHRMPVTLSRRRRPPRRERVDVRLGLAPENLPVMVRVSRPENNPRDDVPECVAALAAA